MVSTVLDAEHSTRGGRRAVQHVIDNLEPLEVVQESTNTHVSVWLEDVVVGRPVRVSCSPALCSQLRVWDGSANRAPNANGPQLSYRSGSPVACAIVLSHTGPCSTVCLSVRRRPRVTAPRSWTLEPCDGSVQSLESS